MPSDGHMSTRDKLWETFMGYLPSHIRPAVLERFKDGTPGWTIMDSALEVLGNKFDSAEMRIRRMEDRIAPLEGDDNQLMRKMEDWLQADPARRRISLYAVDGEFNPDETVVTALLLQKPGKDEAEYTNFAAAVEGDEGRHPFVAQVVGQAMARTIPSALRGALAANLGG